MKRGFYLRQAWRHFREGKGPYLFGLSTITMAFFLFALFLMALENLEGLISTWHKRIQVVCYLEGGIGKEEVERIKEQIAEQPEVGALKYIPPQRIKEELLGDLGEMARGLEGLEEELFPSCLEISLKSSLSLASLEAFARRMEKIQGVAEVQYGGNWLQRASLLLNLLKGGAWVTGGVLLLVTLLITANTLKLVFYQRREEVEILRLVGATEGFIRGPFYLEGTVQGLIGAGVAIGLAALAHNFVQTEVSSRVYPYLSHISFLSLRSIALLLALGLSSGLSGGMISCSGSS